MSNETIIRVSVDASGYEAGMARAKRSAEAFLASQEAAATRTVSAQKAVDEAVANGSQASVRQINTFMQALTKQAETIGLSRGQMLELKAAEMGVADAARPYVDRIKEMEVAMRGAGSAAVAMSETEVQATARISEMVKASLAATAAMTDQSEAAAAYAASVEDVAAAATAAERANERFAASSEAVATAQASVAARAAVASTVISDGAAKVTEALGRQLTALTATEAQMAVYDAQMAGYTETEVAQIGAIAKEIEMRKQQIALGEEMAAAYATEAAAARGAHGATSQITSEIMVMGREASRGNFSRLAGSFTRFLSLAGALDLLLNPLSISIAAIGGSMLYVAEQNEKMNEALVMTGNYAGVTSDQLRNMATAATANGATFNTAAEAVTELASRGRLTGEEIANLGKTAADAATYTSVSVKQMVDEFTKLADEPVKASVKLNDQYHYLTEATYDQIVALEKQGDATGAAQVAVEAFSKAMDERTKEIASNEGIILKGWRDIKSMIDGAVEAIGSFGAAATPGEIAARMDANKAARAPIGQWSDQDEAERVAAHARADAAIKQAQEKARADRQQQALIDAKHAYDTWNQQFATPAQKRAKDMQTYLDTIATPLNLSPEQQLADEAKIDDKYKDHKTPTPKAFHDDAAARFIQQLHDQGAELQLQLSTTDKLTEAQKELVKFNQQIADWKEKTLTADQKSLIAHQDAIRAQLQMNVELDKEIQRRDDIQKLAEKSTQINAQIESFQERNREGYGRELDAFGMGADAQKQVQAINAISREYQRYFDELDKAAAKSGSLGSDQYLAEKQKIQDGLNDSLKDFDDYYAALKQKQDDWTNGTATAFANYIDSAHDASAQAQNAVTQGMKSMEDAVVKFVTTGKVSFTGLVDGMLADLTRMATHGVMSSFFENLSSFGGSIGGGLFASHPGVAATTASALPGDALDNMMKLTKGFGTMAEPAIPKALGGFGAAAQNTASLNAANATVATMTVGTLIGAFSTDGSDTLGSILSSLGGGDMAGAFGFTDAALTGSVDAVTAGAMADSGSTGLTALLGLGGALATGGPTDAGTPYLVGEKGPEVFVPSQSGRIIPNHALTVNGGGTSQQGTPGMSQMFNMNITVPPGTTRATANQQARAVMEHAQIAMRRNG
ncbi:phage tail tape measure protein [Paraburkholderia pallida]|uniref:Phage tail tape measure protein n=1 Tax=Paraburkholderia pallida TaxID=2547399 RepID=A0A4P7CKN4_9BURK|nr:phage tail tape measure protein [Paraburkholderia pallida]QBQ96290.1 phage tail tape measure protein [Paraburkholderia pallida]